MRTLIIMPRPIHALPQRAGSVGICLVAGRKNRDSFLAKVEKQFERLDVAKTKYAASMYDLIVEVTKTAIICRYGSRALK